MTLNSVLDHQESIIQNNPASQIQAIENEEALNSNSEFNNSEYGMAPNTLIDRNSDNQIQKVEAMKYPDINYPTSETLLMNSTLEFNSNDDTVPYSNFENSYIPQNPIQNILATRKSSEIHETTDQFEECPVLELKKSVDEKMENRAKNSKKDLHCFECDLQFDSLNVFKMHVSIVHGTLQKMELKPKLGSESMDIDFDFKVQDAIKKTNSIINDHEAPLSQSVLDPNYSYSGSLTKSLIKNKSINLELTQPLHQVLY